MKTRKQLIILFLFISTVSFAQSAEQDSIWKPVKFIIGEWTGKSSGMPGTGNYERSYQFVLNKKFIEVKNRAVWSPTKENEEGEVHEDLGYISYDEMRKIFVLRQFHIEGFINQYRLDSIAPDGRTLVFITENIENIPDGWRAKETYHLINDNEFTETFELAEPDKSFEVYTKAVLKRK